MFEPHFDRDPDTGLWLPRAARRQLCALLPGLGRPPLGARVRRAGGAIFKVGTTQVDTGTDAACAFSFPTLGPESANRMMVGYFSAKDNANSFSYDTISMFGAGPDNTSAQNQTQYYAAVMTRNLPTGTSGIATVTMDEPIAHDQAMAMACVPAGALMTYKGGEAATATSANSVSKNVNTNWGSPAGLNAGSIVLVSICKGQPAQGVTFTDNSGDASAWVEVEDMALPDNNSRFAAAYKVLACSYLDFTVTATGGGTNTDWVLAMMSFRAP